MFLFSGCLDFMILAQMLKALMNSVLRYTVVTHDLKC
jgi:hypothetical protein